MMLQREIMLTRYDKGSISKVTDAVVCEYPFTIHVNEEEMVTLLCSPKDLNYLALGYLLSEGVIKEKSDIADVNVDEEKGTAYVNLSRDTRDIEYFRGGRRKTKGCSGGTLFNYRNDSEQLAPLTDKLQINYSKILLLMEEFASKSELFQDTGGVHCAALSDGEEILIFNEDVGRHNALDKVIGEAFFKGLSFEDKIVLTSGRISSEMLVKTARRNVSVIVSRSAPMDLALKIGKGINMTIIGFARGQRMNVYNGNERILTENKPIQC